MKVWQRWEHLNKKVLRKTCADCAVSPIDDTVVLAEDTPCALFTTLTDLHAVHGLQPTGDVFPTILIVEPDDRLRESLCLHLSLEGFECLASPNFAAASERTASRLELAVVNLAESGSGLSAHVRELIAMGTPTLILAGPDEQDVALSALEQWADDYVTVPFDIRELIARAHALLRRRRMTEHAADPPAAGHGERIVYDGLLIDPARRRVEVHGRTLTLTEGEFRLLHTIAQQPGMVFRRSQLLSSVWPDTSVVPRSVDVVVMGIRRQLRAAPGRWEIATVRGIGYQLRDTAG
jgi:two-component system alkaline phosphatase synthesis response regulator PhoP